MSTSEGLDAREKLIEAFRRVRVRAQSWELRSYDLRLAWRTVQGIVHSRMMNLCVLIWDRRLKG